VSRSSSLHEDYRDDGPTEIGSDRAFGYTVGAVLMVIGAAKVVIAGRSRWCRPCYWASARCC
jgi:hypothetical protein